MRATLAFLAAIFGTMLLAALLAYPVWLGVHALVPEWAFHGIVGRFWQLLLLIGILLAMRRLGLRGRADWGWGLPRPVFLRQAGAGLRDRRRDDAADDDRDVRARNPPAAVRVRRRRCCWTPSLAALLAGLAVAIVEETFFRGLMYRAVDRESGFVAAAWCTAIVYAAIHFFSPAKIPRRRGRPGQRAAAARRRARAFLESAAGTRFLRHARAGRPPARLRAAADGRDRRGHSACTWAGCS